MNCDKYLCECKAQCCTCCPLPEALVRDHQDKMVEQPIEIWRAPPFQGVPQCFAPTASMKCCFLKEDCSCAVYDKRPYICRVYGDESTPYLCCTHQHKDGQPRSKRAQQRLLKKLEKKNKKMKPKIKQFNESILAMNVGGKDGDTPGCITVSGNARGQPTLR